MGKHIHIHVNVICPEISAALGRIEAALKTQRQDIKIMTKVTDAAIAELGDTLIGLTDAVTAVGALIDGAVKAQKDLADELEAEGQDVTKLREMNASFAAARDVLVAKTLANTVVDPNA